MSHAASPITGCCAKILGSDWQPKLDCSRPAGVARGCWTLCPSHSVLKDISAEQLLMKAGSYHLTVLWQQYLLNSGLVVTGQLNVLAIYHTILLHTMSHIDIHLADTFTRGGRSIHDTSSTIVFER